METKHTKEQWLRDGRLIYALGKKGIYDANIFSCSVSNDNQMITDVELYANAKLIAAAPELLEALIELIEWEKYNHIDESILNKINNAIKKATE